MKTHDPREFIADPPGAMAHMVLVDPAELVQDGATTLTFYDVAIDEFRPATKADIDALVAASARGVKLREGLKAAVAAAKAKDADVPLAAVEALLASVEAKPEA